MSIQSYDAKEKKRDNTDQIDSIQLTFAAGTMTLPRCSAPLKTAETADSASKRPCSAMLTLKSK